MTRKPSHLHNGSGSLHSNPERAQVECLYMIACQLERLADAAVADTRREADDG